jgi:hypothetical protein
MEYRGKRYTVARDLGPEPWKWTIHLDETQTKFGTAPTRAIAITNAIWAIDKELAPKKGN